MLFLVCCQVENIEELQIDQGDVKELGRNDIIAKWRLNQTLFWWKFLLLIKCILSVKYFTF